MSGVDLSEALLMLTRRFQDTCSWQAVQVHDAVADYSIDMSH